MRRMQFCVTILFFVFSLINISAEMWPSCIPDIYSLYPTEDYLIGIGEVAKTENLVKDNRTADILARLDIAEQVKVKIEAETVDQICDDKEGLFKELPECRNAFKMIVKITVDESLVGARIVAHCEEGGIVCAIAVLKRSDLTAQHDSRIMDIINNSRESVNSAQ